MTLSDSNRVNPQKKPVGSNKNGPTQTQGNAAKGLKGNVWAHTASNDVVSSADTASREDKAYCDSPIVSLGSTRFSETVGNRTLAPPANLISRQKQVPLGATDKLFSEKPPGQTKMLRPTLSTLAAGNSGMDTKVTLNISNQGTQSAPDQSIVSSYAARLRDLHGWEDPNEALAAYYEAAMSGTASQIWEEIKVMALATLEEAASKEAELNVELALKGENHISSPNNTVSMISTHKMNKVFICLHYRHLGQARSMITMH